MYGDCSFPPMIMAINQLSHSDPDKLRRWRTISTFILGLSVPLGLFALVDVSFALLLVDVDGWNRVLQPGLVLCATVMMGVIGFRGMRGHRPYFPLVILMFMSGLAAQLVTITRF